MGQVRTWASDGLVFTTRVGERLIPGSVSRGLSRLSTGAGLPRIRLHALRHTWATLGLEAGASLLEVSRRLGQSAISITAGVDPT
ncbi:MAG: tyrosine-type recombinase/integrase [Pseudonocardia sp.]|nr:tyrosine-type recombinase/integrase [Pseudonocardia sp.]